jgi:MFS family permease
LNFRFYALLVSQTATNLAFALYTMVVVMHLYDETGSTTLAATVSLISVMSRMISTIVLPALSDRFKLPSLLMASQIVQLLFLSFLFLLFSQSFSTLNTIFIFIILSVISFFNGWFSPIKSSLVRAIVSEDKRVKANSFLSTVDQTFLFAGWTLGGLLLSIIGKEKTLVIIFILLLISIGCLSLVKVKQASSIQAQERLFARLTSGWKYLFQNEGLRVIITMDLIEAWVGTIWIGAVTLTFVEEALHKGEAWWGYINGGYYLGTILGGLFVYRLSKVMEGRLTLFMLGGSFLFGVLTFTYGFISNPYIALFLVLLMGPSYQLRDLAQETMLQNSADEKTLTKILAARASLVQFIFIFSIIGIGALTDFIGVRLVYIFSGCLLIFSSLYGFVQLSIRKRRVFLEGERYSLK